MAIAAVPDEPEHPVFHSIPERCDEVHRLKNEEGWSFRQIARHLGISHTQAREDYLRASSERPAVDKASAKSGALEHLDFLQRETLKILRRTHYVAQFGKIAFLEEEQPDGSVRSVPLVDDGPILAAIRELRQIEERRAKILGYEAPRQQPVLVLTDEILLEALAQREAELGELEPGGPENSSQLQEDEIVDAELVPDEAKRSSDTRTVDEPHPQAPDQGFSDEPEAGKLDAEEPADAVAAGQLGNSELQEPSSSGPEFPPAGSRPSFSDEQAPDQGQRLEEESPGGDENLGQAAP